MKKILSIILGIILVAGSITVAAQFMDNAPKIVVEADLTERYNDEIYMVYDKPQMYQDVQVSDKRENAVFQMINRSGKTKEEIYDDVFAYKFFLKMYNPSLAEQTYMDAMILKGADITTLISIFDFWRTTAEDISLIGQIYDLSGRSDNRYWIEEAFNELTENRHGVLDAEAIYEYFEKGLTREDIVLANTLCRKGVYTITEMLDKVAEGESWASIVADIDQNIGDMLKSEDFESTAEIAEYIHIAEISRENPSVYLSVYLAESEQVQESVSIRYMSETRRLDISNKIHLEMLADGIIVREERTEASEYFIAEAIANGVSEEEAEALLDGGYSSIDIFNASVESELSKADVETILSEQRASELKGEGGARR